RRVIDRLLEAVRPIVVDPIVLVNNDGSLDQIAGTRVVGDVEPGAGALVGLYSGLRAVTTPLAVALACDMPFVSTTLLRGLLAEARGWDAVVPLIGGQPEPLYAIYRQTCLPAVEAAPSAGQKRLISFLEAVRVRYVD